MPGPRGPGERRALLGRGPQGARRRWRRAAAAAVLLVQMLERAAFFGVSSNLVLYLTGVDLHWAGGQASRAELVFLGASYLLSPVGGWLADVYLGRYRALTLSLLLYLAAAGLLAATASSDGRPSFCGEMPAQPLEPGCPEPGCPRALRSPYCAPTICSALLLLALAASSVRSNLTSFGADQVSPEGGGRDAEPNPGQQWVWGSAPDLRHRHRFPFFGLPRFTQEGRQPLQFRGQCYLLTITATHPCWPGPGLGAARGV